MINRRWNQHIITPQRFKAARDQGFTLLELLVSIVIGAFITLLLMGLVLDLAEVNQRDASRSNVQQEMQTAIDYLVQDLREAVFVYNGQCLAGGSITIGTTLSRCPGIVNHIPAALSTGGSTPILAFWRTEPLPEGIAKYCSDNTNEGLPNPAVRNAMETTNLVSVCVSGKTYSLVVYSLNTSNADSVWAGQARLTRYRLTRFRDNAVSAADDRNLKDYVDPTHAPLTTFVQWPLSTTGTNLQTTRPPLDSGDNPVLLDFVSAKFKTDAGVDVTPSCQDFIDSTATSFQDPANQITPLTATNPPRSFYACVRGGGLSATAGQNQDVLLSLVGNLTGKPGYPKAGPQVAPIQTRVLIRGIVAR